MMPMITPRELEWAAAFLDGEGCFMGATPKVQKSICVVAVQADPELLYKLERLFGGYVRQQKKVLGLGKKLIWRWYIFGPRAAGIMMTLYPLLSTRRKAKIKDILSTWKLIPRPYPNKSIYQQETDRELLKAPDFLHWLKGCDERTREICYALSEERTLKSVGKQFHMTAIRVAQIKATVLQSFRGGLKPVLIHSNPRLLRKAAGIT